MYRTLLALILLELLTLTSSQRLSGRRISTNVKDDILNADSIADAYNKYLEAYTDPEDMLLMASTDPVSLRKQSNIKQRVFTHNLKAARAHNRKFKNGQTSFQMTVNSFSAMDADSRKKFLGVSRNMSLLENGRYYSPPALKSSGTLQALPDSLNWKDKGFVTTVKNQGSCGSCWSYGAIGPIEYAYKASTGKLLSFSEQELLDCSYEHAGSNEDGCNGSWYTTAWDFVIAKNHLPSEANYPYKGKDHACSHDSHSNDIAGKIQVTGYTQSAKTETAVLTDLMNQGPLAVAFTVEDDFYVVGSGIYDGCKNPTYPNHAVVLTGYSSNYFEIKNSWGADWGLDGYARFERGRDICGLLSYAYYIEYKDLDDSDSGDNGGDDKEENKEEEKEDEEEKEEGEKEEDKEDEEEGTEENQEVKECREPDDKTGVNYRGTLSKTKSGRPCQNWESQSPNEHSRTPEFYPGTGLKGNNYCRNPDHDEGGPWCFNSLSKKPEWEYCDVPVCGEETTEDEEQEEEEEEGEEEEEEATEWATESNEDCLSEDDPTGKNYRGLISKTESGRECLNWNRRRSTSISRKYSYKVKMFNLENGLEKNYCRRPDQTSARPWCYINRGGHRAWEYCDIPKCEKKEEDSSCVDDHEDCATWAYLDFCKDPDYEEFMSSNCKKSCETCGEGKEEETEEPTEETCMDDQEDCGYWAKKGFCNPGSLYGDYMELHCRKSCGKCGEGDSEKYTTMLYTDLWDKKTDQEGTKTEAPTEERKEITEAPKTEERKEKTDAPSEECPGGLTRCPDGSCKHVHMCKKE